MARGFARAAVRAHQDRAEDLATMCHEFAAHCCHIARAPFSLHSHRPATSALAAVDGGLERHHAWLHTTPQTFTYGATSMVIGLVPTVNGISRTTLWVRLRRRV
jgi:hypothetical protein